MPPLMRAERAFPLRRPLSQDHGFGRFLARRLVAGGDWALVQLCDSLREQFSSIGTAEVVEALLDGEQAWTSDFYLKSFDMDSV